MILIREREREVGSPSESQLHNRFFINGKLDIKMFEDFYDSNPNIKNWDTDEKVAALEYCRQIGLMSSFFSRRGIGIVKWIVMYFGGSMALGLFFSILMQAVGARNPRDAYGIALISGAAFFGWYVYLLYCMVHGLYKEYEYGKSKGRADEIRKEL